MEKDVRDSILEALRADDRNLMWLSKKTQIPYTTLYYCLVRKQFKVSEKNIITINDVLNTSLKA